MLIAGLGRLWRVTVHDYRNRPESVRYVRALTYRGAVRRALRLPVTSGSTMKIERLRYG